MIQDIKVLLGNNLVLKYAVMSAAVVLVAWIAYLITKVVIARIIRRLVLKTKFQWDDDLMNRKVFDLLAYLAPGIVIFYGAELFPDVAYGLRKGVYLYVLILGLLFIGRCLSAIVDYYQKFSVSQRKPIKGLVQLLKIFVYIIGAIAAVSLLLDKSPWGLLSGIGAFTAILMLVFRDTILSFVAGIQLMSNDLIRKGDWLEVPSYGADGNVVDIALHTVLVQNWDLTIVSIPTFRLMEGSFKNWRGMSQARGRRIKRAMILDQTSIHFLNKEQLKSLSRIQLLAPYLSTREQEVEAYNAEHKVNEEHPVNGRRLTNLGCFRVYATKYLQNNDKLRKDMTMMVRQLPPTEEGLPLEVYTFSSDTNWVNYEGIQSDIFDHLLAAMPWFGLRVYQRGMADDPRIPAEFKQQA